MKTTIMPLGKEVMSVMMMVEKMVMLKAILMLVV